MERQMKAADYFKLTYSDQNTNILSMYLSQMKQTQRSAIARQRDISTRIGRLETQLARWRRDYRSKISADPKRKEAINLLKINYKERKNLREAMSRDAKALYMGGIDVDAIRQRGQVTALTAQQMRANAVKGVRKEYKLTGQALSTAEGLEVDMLENYNDINLMMAALNDERTKVAGMKELQREGFASVLFTKFTSARDTTKGSLTDEDIKAAIYRAYDINVKTQKVREQEQKAAEQKAKDSIKGASGARISIDAAKKRLIDDYRKNVKALSKMQRTVRASERTLKVDPKEQKRIREMMSNKNLIAYLDDAKDFSIDGFYTDADGMKKPYDKEEGEELRAELKVIGDRDATLVPVEIMQKIDRTGYLEVEAQRRALQAQMKSIGTDSTIPRMLSAPQFNLFTPMGQINAYIRDQKSGLEKNRLMAGYIAETGENADFTRLYNAAAPNQRIVFAVMPMVADRLANAKKGKMTPKSRIEKKAARYITNMGKDWSSSLRAPELVNMAESLYKDNETKKAEFITYVLSAQRAMEQPGMTYENATDDEKKMKRAAQKQVVKEIKEESLEEVARRRRESLPRKTKPGEHYPKELKTPGKVKATSKPKEVAMKFTDGSNFLVNTRANGTPLTYTWTSADGTKTKTFKVGQVPALDKQAQEAYGKDWAVK
jgi:hypothetical protein